ncbi:MAG: tetratricopeptide repeat protein [Methylophilales bacterium]|nr:tetratricopeptide repeat protein [Methylophilales bacterium]
MLDIVSSVQHAMSLHSQGLLAEASEAYLAILKQYPDLFDGLHLLGVVRYQQGQHEEAIRLIKQALVINPNSAPAHSNLGNVYRETKRHAEAINAYQHAVATNPGYVEGHYNIGNLYFEMGRNEDALVAYDRVLNLNPHHEDTLINKGLLQYNMQRNEEAIASFDRLLEFKPKHIGALFNRALALYASQRYVAAIESYDLLLESLPHDVTIHCNRGMAFYALGMHEQAVISYDRGLMFDPNCARSLANRGTALHQLKQYEAALASYNEAISINAGYAEAYSNRGGLLHEMGRLDDALASYDTALNIYPEYAAAHCNRGVLMMDLLRHEEAMTCYNRALEIRSEYSDAHWNLGICRLRLGDFENGWSQHEYRWQVKQLANGQPHFDQPFWRGENVAGKTLLIYAEQGLGDTLQFYRYVKLLTDQGAMVLLKAQSALIPIFNGLNDQVTLLKESDLIPDFDLHCPLLSLPMVFNTRLGTIPADTPYLYAKPDKVAHWQGVLGDKTLPRVGIVWSGNPAHKNDHNRSIALEKLAHLFDPKYQIISLQKEVKTNDVSFLENHLEVLHFGDVIQDFSDTAALVELMDLVITVDTSIAHLAGAMGKPVWILLPYSPDWRWMVEREDSPWYPTARLFRQPAIGDWGGVIEKVSQELAKLFKH